MKFHYMALIGVTVGAVAIWAATFEGGSATPRTTTKAEAPDLSISPRHTMGKFLELRDGASYDEAARTLGYLGHEVPKGSPDGAPGVGDEAGVLVYAWPNADGSRIVLVFKNDRLVQKAQIGLR